MMNIVTAPRRDSLHWEAEEISWEELVTWMLDPADHKESGNYILGSLRPSTREHKGQKCTALHRTRGAVVSRDALMLDSDTPEEGFIQAVKDLRVRLLVHTTFSSTKEHPRYRVIIPLSRSVSPLEYEASATHVMERVGSSSFDPGSSQPERYMFRPAGGPDFWFHVQDGPLMEPHAVPDGAPRPALKRDPFALPGAVGAFNRVYRDLDTLIEVFDIPYDRKGDRWSYQGASSAPGVVELDEGLWWSDHQTDPASGHAQTAFDLVRIHWFGSEDDDTDPGRPLHTLPSYCSMTTLAEADPAVREEQILAEFGPLSPVKSLGYDTDSSLDDDLAKHLADRGIRDGFRYVSNRGWLKWDGRSWGDCDSLELWGPISAEVRALAEEWMSSGKSSSQIKKLKTFLDVPKTKRLVESLRAVLRVDSEDLDADPDLLTCGNGTVDLRTGELRPHSRDDLITYMTPVPYDPSATHPDWDAVLSSIREDSVEWMQVRCGQAATGWRVPDDVIPILQGGGANGKTTFTGAITDALGGYSRILSERALFNSQGDHPTELMSLQGARFALLEETPEGVPLNVKRLKDVLGASHITARRMRQDEETFATTHSLFMTTNYHPRVTETDAGTWRRLALVDFPYTYGSGEGDRPTDPHLRYRMETSPSGQHEAVLAWLVGGARKWYALGKVMPGFPPSVRENVRVWRAASDPLQDYLTTEVIADSDSMISVRDLYDDFSEWQLREGHPLWNERTFANRFRQHELVKSMRLEDGRARPASSREKRKLSRRDELQPLPDGQVRVWVGIRFS